MSTFGGIEYASATGRVRRYQVYSEAINGRVQVRNVGGQRLEWTLSFPPMTRDEFRQVWQQVDGADGMQGTFTLSLPDPLDPGEFNTYTVRIMGPVQEYELRSDGLVDFEIDVVQVI